MMPSRVCVSWSKRAENKRAFSAKKQSVFIIYLFVEVWEPFVDTACEVVNTRISSNDVGVLPVVFCFCFSVRFFFLRASSDVYLLYKWMPNNRM